MELVSKYVREQKRYAKNELKHLFEFDESGIEKFLKTLKSYGIIKCVDNNNKQLEMTDLLDEDIEIKDVTADNGDCLYVFTYVGIITIGNRIIKVYPKYILAENTEPIEEMKQVIKVLDRYSHSDQQIINMFNGDDENKSFNMLAIILYLLRDYYAYGVYTNTEDIREVNGEGLILWEKTIDETFALIRDNRPYYMELYTEKTIDDEFDYFKRLHECVLTDCSKMLHMSQLDMLFGIDELVLSDEEIDDFGDREYILDRIQKELNIQFNTRRQILLKTLYAYIAQNRKLFDENDGISMFGTNAFHAVWENVCAEIFDNKLKTPLIKLGLTSEISNKYDSRQTLIEVIEKPKWSPVGGDGIEASDTLIPDLISIPKVGDLDYFFIFDAKYYNIQLEENKALRGNPGIGDVTKQYLYQLAYKNFINDHNIAMVRNCFLMPTEKNMVIHKGVARLAMLEALGLENIHVFQIPAKKAYELYLERKKFDLSQLQLDEL